MSTNVSTNQAVELADDFTAALEAGEARAAAYYAVGRTTLVGSISLTDLANWDASDEKALVSDPDGIDLPDEMPQDLAA